MRGCTIRAIQRNHSATSQCSTFIQHYHPQKLYAHSLFRSSGMPSQPKPRKPGRPRLPKGHAKSGAIQVRLNDDVRKKVEAAAKASKQTVSEWIRSTIDARLAG